MSINFNGLCWFVSSTESKIFNFEAAMHMQVTNTDTDTVYSLEV